MLVQFSIPSQKTNMDDCSVRKYGAVGDGINDDTAAIQKAINESTSIYFPQGTYKITATLNLYKKVGVHMFGDGNGGSNGLGSSKIYWAGPAGGVILQLYSSANCIVERLAFQGIKDGIPTNPGFGIYITGDNKTGPCHFNVIRDCSVSNVQGGSGYGVLIGSIANDDINANVFENVLLVYCKVGFVQMGTQTVNNYMTNVECLLYQSMGVDFIAGNAIMKNCSFFGDTCSTVDVRIGAAMLYSSIRDSYHEILSDRPPTACAYQFPNTGERPWSTELDNCRVLWNIGGGNIVDYQQQGPLSITNCNFDGIGTNGVININNTAVKPQPLTIYGNNLFPGVASFSISGNVDYQNATQQSICISTAPKNADTSTLSQNWFDNPSSFQLLGSTTYEIEGILLLNNPNVANAHALSFNFGGSATYNSLMVEFKSSVNGGNDSTFLLTSTNGKVVALLPSALTTLHIKGILRVNARGTMTPQFSFSVSPGGFPTIMQNSYLKVTPLGSNTVKAIGNFTN